MKVVLNIILMLCVAFGATGQTLGASGSTLAQQGDEAYSSERYQDAVNLYRQSIEQEGVSSIIYYNLGNAYYRCDSLAQAILSYERALKIDPTNKDARTNLEFVNTKIIDLQNDDSSYSTIFIDRALHMLTANGWAIVSISLFVVVLLMVGGYIFLNGVAIRKVCFFGGLVMLVVLGLSIFVTLTAVSRATSRDQAIVTAESAQLSTSPATPVNTSQQAVLLHEGTKVTVLDSLSTPLDSKTKMWLEVLVNNEYRAWIDRDAVEII